MSFLCTFFFKIVVTLTVLRVTFRVHGNLVDEYDLVDENGVHDTDMGGSPVEPDIFDDDSGFRPDLTDESTYSAFLGARITKALSFYTFKCMGLCMTTKWIL